MGIILLLFLIIIVPIILIVLFIKYLQKDIHLFEFKIRQTYCYIVMFSALCFNIYAIINLISNISDLLFPTENFVNNNSYYGNILTLVVSLILCSLVFFRHKKIAKENKSEKK